VFEVRGCDFDMQRRIRRVTLPEYGNSHASAQEAVLFRDFSALVLGGRRDPHWGEAALGTQQVLDACRRSASERREVTVA
jgi:predicted dehydrogenase